MKHLKHINELIKVDSMTEWSNYIGNYVDFTEYELKRLLEVVPRNYEVSIYSTKDDKWVKLSIDSIHIGCAIWIQPIKRSRLELIIGIRKLEDDYFAVIMSYAQNDEKLICDQIDEVVDTLKSNF